MSNSIIMGTLKRASLTVMVDNKANLIVESTDRVKYFADEPLLAEHGFSVLIQFGDSKRNILLDAGGSRIALMENLRRMKIDITTIKKIVLSHGHWDHYTAISDLLKEMKLFPKGKEWDASVKLKEIDEWIEDSKLPIVAHPAAFRERWRVKDSGNLVGPSSQPPQQEWLSLGAKMIITEDPYQLGPGCWATGYIPRKSFENAGRSEKLRYRSGSNFIPDDLEEDQAIVINIEGKGLVIISGCAHSGIVNTIKYAMELFEVNVIYAVIGGFHLARTNDDEIEQTIDYIQSLEPSLVVPSHCTGFKAISRFAQKMPEEFIESVVGTTYLL